MDEQVMDERIKALIAELVSWCKEAPPGDGKFLVPKDDRAREIAGTILEEVDVDGWSGCPLCCQ